MKLRTQYTVTVCTLERRLSYYELIATSIVEYFVHVKNNDRSDMGNINLKVNWARRRVQGELIATHKVNETWAGINIYTPSISTQNEGFVEINDNALIGSKERT